MMRLRRKCSVNKGRVRSSRRNTGRRSSVGMLLLLVKGKTLYSKVKTVASQTLGANKDSSR
jgi:hypothetical protein